MFDLRLLFVVFFLLLNYLIVGFILFGYQSAEFQSPPVSVTGSCDLPDHPPTSPPVAGAGGETG